MKLLMLPKAEKPLQDQSLDGAEGLTVCELSCILTNLIMIPFNKIISKKSKIQLMKYSCLNKNNKALLIVFFFSLFESLCQMKFFKAKVQNASLKWAQVYRFISGKYNLVLFEKENLQMERKDVSKYSKFIKKLSKTN